MCFNVCVWLQFLLIPLPIISIGNLLAGTSHDAGMYFLYICLTNTASRSADRQWDPVVLVRSPWVSCPPRPHIRHTVICCVVSRCGFRFYDRMHSSGTFGSNLTNNFGEGRPAIYTIVSHLLFIFCPAPFEFEFLYAPPTHIVHRRCFILEKVTLLPHCWFICKNVFVRLGTVLYCF